MKKIIITIIFNYFIVGHVEAQFGSRVLNDEQSRESFVKLKYHSMIVLYMVTVSQIQHPLKVLSSLKKGQPKLKRKIEKQ